MLWTEENIAFETYIPVCHCPVVHMDGLKKGKVDPLGSHNEKLIITQELVEHLTDNFPGSNDDNKYL